MKKDLRIVSLLPSATEIICSLGLEKNLVGITHECDFPVSVKNLPQLTTSRISHETMSSREIDHAVRSNLDGHGSIYNLNEQLLRDLKPDLIITQELCEVCAVSYKTVQKAAKMYVAAATVLSLEPNTIADIFDNIKTVGELCSVKDRAEKLVGDLQLRLDKIKEKVSEANPKSKIQNPKSIMMLEWLEPPFAPGHWVPEQVEYAGGIPLMGKAGQKSATTTYEKIAETQPEVLVLIPCGYYTKDILRQLPNTIFPDSFAEIPAVKMDEIWAADATSYFSRPAPRVVDGAEILAKIVHPEIFGAPSESQAIRVSKDLMKFKTAVAA